MKRDLQAFAEGKLCVKVENEWQMETLIRAVRDAGKLLYAAETHYNKDYPYVYYNPQGHFSGARFTPPFFKREQIISFHELEEYHLHKPSDSAKEALQLLDDGNVENGFLGEQIFACVTDTSLSYDDRGLIKLYLNASETERIVMDAVLINLTGHDMDGLLELAMKEQEQEEEHNQEDIFDQLGPIRDEVIRSGTLLLSKDSKSGNIKINIYSYEDKTYALLWDNKTGENLRYDEVDDVRRDFPNWSVWSELEALLEEQEGPELD